MIPHVAKATGVYLNSMLATMEVRRAGYEEAILLTSEGFVADGPGENIFVVRGGVLYTPDLATSILPGITRGVVIELALGLGLDIEERDVDLYEAAGADDSGDVFGLLCAGRGAGPTAWEWRGPPCPAR